MKYLLIIFIFGFFSSVYSRSFNDMLKVVNNSAFSYAFKCNFPQKVFFESEYNPYKFHQNGKTLEKLKYNDRNHSIHYVGDYRIILGNDTILLEVVSFSFGIFYESGLRHNFEKIKYHPLSSSGIVNCAFYYNQKNEKWEYRPKHFDLAKWIHEAEVTHQRSSSFELLDTALTSFLHEMELSYPKKEILVLDNTFGHKFFFRQYDVRRFDYMIASERDLTNKVLKSYKCLVGWCSIEFVKNHLILTLRAVKSEDYKRKKKQKTQRNIDDITCFMHSYEFAYSPTCKKWCLLSSGH